MGGTCSSDMCPQTAPPGRPAVRRDSTRVGIVRAFGGLQIEVSPERSSSRATAAGEGGRLLILNLERSATFVAGDRVFALAAGDLLLVDARLPVLRDRPGGSREVRVHLPNMPMPEHLGPPNPVAPCLIDGRGGIGMLLRELICALLVAQGTFCPREEEGVRAAVDALVAAAHCARRDNCHPRMRDAAMVCRGEGDPPRQWHMLVECVEAQLSDPALSPAAVAAMRGISTRHLHRLFRQAGESFGSFVRKRRLQRCRDDLADPRFDRLPLTEIAYRWGFSDSSHFSRCFRSAFGCTAREFRARQARIWPTSMPGVDTHRPGTIAHEKIS